MRRNFHLAKKVVAFPRTSISPILQQENRSGELKIFNGLVSTIPYYPSKQRITHFIARNFCYKSCSLQKFRCISSCSPIAITSNALVLLSTKDSTLNWYPFRIFPVWCLWKNALWKGTHSIALIWLVPAAGWRLLWYRYRIGSASETLWDFSSGSTYREVSAHERSIFLWFIKILEPFDVRKFSNRFTETELYFQIIGYVCRVSLNFSKYFSCFRSEPLLLRKTSASNG